MQGYRIRQRVVYIGNYFINTHLFLIYIAKMKISSRTYFYA